MQSRYYQSPQVEQLEELQDSILRLADEADVDRASFPSLEDPDLTSRVRGRLDSKFTILVIGQVNSGKSSFINSLLGRRLFIPSAKPTDGMVSVLMPAEQPQDERAERVAKDGSTESFESLDAALEFIRQGSATAEEHREYREVRLYIHHPLLKKFRFINTPGLGDRLKSYASVTRSYLQKQESDLIVWTFHKDMPVNREEVDFFDTELRRRAGNIIGLLTHCLEGKENELDYDPLDDPKIRDSRRQIQETAGEFIEYLLPYDSHVARDAVQKLHSDADSADQEVIPANLKRSGHSDFHAVLDEVIGKSEDDIEAARVKLVEKTLAAHSLDLARVADAAEETFARQAEFTEEELQSWRNVEEEIIGPFRERLHEKIRQIASRRAKDLVTLMADAAENAIEENFGLLSTLARSTGDAVGLVDNSTSEMLSREIEKAIDAELQRQKFDERLRKQAVRVTRAEMQELQSQLRRALDEETHFDTGGVSPDSTSAGVDADDVLADAVVAGSKGAVAALLKTVAKKLEQTATKEATEQATKSAAKSSLGASAAKVVGALSVILVPFDFQKMWSEFKSGKKHLKNSVRSKYEARKSVYARRLSDTLMPGVDDFIDTLLENARTRAGRSKQRKEDLNTKIAKSRNLSRRMRQCADEFKKQE
jgi:acyl carrier protein